MTFEDSVQIVHDLSTKLAQYVELKGDLVMLSKGTTHYKTLFDKVSEIANDIEFLMGEIEITNDKIYSDISEFL